MKKLSELKPQEGGRGKGIFSFPAGEEKCDFVCLFLCAVCGSKIYFKV